LPNTITTRQHRAGTASVATSSLSTMDNQTRSEISRKKAIDAALTILTREGVGGLTFDSLSRESGISKGGLLHQFRTKQGVLCALLEHQKQQFEQIARDYMAKEGASKAEPNLAAQIAIYRESINQPNSVARAVLAALVENPNLLDEMKTSDAEKMKALQDEATDLDLSLLRYFAASGLAFHSLLGLSPLDDSARNRLFDRLLDEASWQGRHSQTKRRKRSAG
jgi:AcrR family transcriptional regulator